MSMNSLTSSFASVIIKPLSNHPFFLAFIIILIILIIRYFSNKSKNDVDGKCLDCGIELTIEDLKDHTCIIEALTNISHELKRIYDHLRLKE